MKALKPFRGYIGSNIVGNGNTKDISDCDTCFVGDDIFIKFKDGSGQEVVPNVNGAGVSGQRADAVMNGGKELQWNEAAKEMLERESSGGGYEKHIFCLLSLGCRQLGEKDFQGFGNGKVQEPGSEVIFPGDGGPSGGVGRRIRTDMKIIEKKESLKDSGVVEAERGEGRLRFIFVVGGIGGGRGKMHNVSNDGYLVREHINSPFVSSGGAGGGVRLKKSENIGGIVWELDFLDFKSHGFRAESGEFGGERHGYGIQLE